MARAVMTTERNFEINQGKLQRDMLMRRLGRFGMVLTPIVSYFFLWAPIVVLIVFSFNNSNSVSVWQGFTGKWYQGIWNSIFGLETEGSGFRTELLLASLKNSVIVGLFSTVLSTALGTTFALAVARGNFPGKKIFDALFYLPVVIPEITQAVSLAVFFGVLFRGVARLSCGDPAGEALATCLEPKSGFATIIAGHVAFSISFVAIVVRARLATMDPTLEEAANDLGANHFQTFWRITFPILAPGIVAGALLALTLSLDDFVVTFFNSGIGTTTLPLFVYGLLKQRVSPEINAISTLMILVSVVLVGASLLLQNRSTK
jgi:spermidine/putrescine transport system permease protein